MSPADIIEIRLYRGPCFGTCPVFDFTASRHAGYRYDGHRHVDPLGKRSGGFPGFLFNRLAEVCLDLKVLELEDEYPATMDDAPMTLVIVRHKTGDKTIRNGNGDLGPVRLWAFAALIEVAMQQAFEIEDRRKG